jgi:dTMP kinase
MAKMIVLEGIDGAGTTTQTQRLIARLKAEGIDARPTREPTDGPIGVMIRQMLAMRIVRHGEDGGSLPMTRETLALLFAADRLDHVASIIEPALARGQWVISDRYFPSSLVYQGDVERGEGGVESLDYAWVQGLNARARRAELTIFLEIDLETSLARIAGRGASRDIYETREKLERLVRRYEEVIALLEAAGEPVCRIDARAPLDVVEAEIWAAVQRLG